MSEMSEMSEKISELSQKMLEKILGAISGPLVWTLSFIFFFGLPLYCQAPNCSSSETITVKH